VPDLLVEQKIFEHAGIGFGEQETMLLQKSLQKLAKTPGMVNVRLWGKVQGTERDYYVAEGAYDKGEDENAEARLPDFEAHGTGINKNFYWACNSPLQEWVLLPDLTPQDLNAARGVKVCFSGNLDRDITTNPFFFRKEAFYLRAQIARICHST